ncbi:MAG: metallophosphoesterase family protein [Bacteroidaceae bacterium]
MTLRQLLNSVCVPLMCWLLLGCDMFEAHPYDALVRGETDINARSASRIALQTEDKDTIRFAFISDTQRWYDETKKAVADINQRQDIDFVIHGGDLSDFGATHEFVMQRDILLRLRQPWVALLGNHDCLGTGESVHQRIFGPSNFYFTAGQVLFVCLNTNCMEYDYSEPVPDFGFLDSVIANVPAGIRHTVVAMHVPPFDLEFNNNVARVFQAYLHQLPGLLCCIYGHGHRYAVDDLFGDGIQYLQTPCIEKRAYLLFTLTPDGYEHQLVSF